MSTPRVKSQVLVRNADSLAVWVHVEKSSGAKVSSKELISLLNAEIQHICNDHISTLDDDLKKKSPRPNPTPRVFIEQGNELSRLLWLHWED